MDRQDLLAASSLALLLTACSAAPPGGAQGPDGEGERGTGGSQNPVVPVKRVPPRGRVVDSPPTFLESSPVVVRQEPLGTINGPMVRVQLAAGEGPTLAVLASNAHDPARLFWLTITAGAADRWQVASGPQGELLDGKIRLLQRKNNESFPHSHADSDNVRALEAVGWGAPSPLTPEQHETLLGETSQQPANGRRIFQLTGASGTRHDFGYEGSALVWRSGQASETLCDCNVVRAFVDATDGAPVLIVAEEVDTAVYRRLGDHWQRSVLAHAPAPVAPPEQCSVSSPGDTETKLSASCSAEQTRLLAVDGAALPNGGGALVYALERSVVEQRCIARLFACDPSGPTNTCRGNLPQWRCTSVVRSRSAELLQAKVTALGVATASLGGLVTPTKQPDPLLGVALAIHADADVLHVALASARVEGHPLQLAHLELAPSGARLPARAVFEPAQAPGAALSDAVLLARGFTGFGLGVFDGGELELASSSYRVVNADGPRFVFEAEARFPAGSTGHGLQVSNDVDIAELAVDSAGAALSVQRSRTEPVGPLTHTDFLGRQAFDATQLHRYRVELAGSNVTFSVDGKALSVATLRASSPSFRVRVGCVGDCDAGTSRSAWRSLGVTKR